MARFSDLVKGALLLAAFAPAQAALVTEEVSYQAGDATLKGYIAYDDAVEGRRPGVLVVHEWWGHNAYARKRAEMLAEMGYTALAVDMYGDGRTADHPKDAGKFSGEIKQNLPLMRERFLAALDLLRTQATVDPERDAAIGYCFGGGVVLEMAREGVDLDGVASFHGSLAGPGKAEKGKVKAAVMVANGAEDPMVKPDDLLNFSTEMDEAGVNYRLFNYPGAKHSFTNPEADRYGAEFGVPLAYNAEADKASWAELDKFLKEIFK